MYKSQDTEGKNRLEGGGDEMESDTMLLRERMSTCVSRMPASTCREGLGRLAQPYG